MKAEFERYVPLAEVREELKKKDIEKMVYEQKLAFEHASKFSSISKKAAKEFVEKLVKDFEMPEKLAVKVCDILPSHPDDLKVILMKERFKFTAEQQKKVLEMVEFYKAEP